MAHRTYKQYQKRQRGRVIAVQAALGVSIAVLTAGVGYASLCIVRGQAVLPGLPQTLAAWNPFSQSAASDPAAPGTASARGTDADVPSIVPAAGAEGQPALTVPGQATPEPAAPEPAAPEPAAPEQASPEPAAPEQASPEQAAPEQAAQSAEVQELSAGAQTRSGVWNTASPLFAAVPSVSDTRLLAVPENGRVSDDYFRDALFIGDSVTQGFGVYPQYQDWMRVCAYKGIGPQNVLQNMVGQRPDSTAIEMWDDIKTQQGVANIYILFGANALLAQSDEAFLKYYGDLLDLLREQFPDVPIYVQSLTPTTQAYGQKRPALARDHLRSVNEAVAQLAVSRGMYYVDLWEVLADEEGYLRADLSGDGLHLHDGSKYRPWLDYLATHTVYSAHNAQFVLADSGAYS